MSSSKRRGQRFRVLMAAVAAFAGMTAISETSASAGTVDGLARCYVTSWSGYTGKTLPKSRVRCGTYLSNQFDIVGRSTNGIIVDIYGQTRDEWRARRRETANG